MTCPRVLGIDPSLTSSGVARPDGTTGRWTTSYTGEERLDLIRQLLYDTLDAEAPQLVVIEGYSYASANQAHQIGELGGVLRLELYRSHIPYIEVAPKSLKKYATGNASAPKNEMLAAAIRRLGYPGHSDDEADAAWLRAMALDHYGHPVCDMPAAHREALKKPVWPELAA